MDTPPNTPLQDDATETPLQADAVPEPAAELDAALDAARLKEVATKLAEDVRPLVHGVIERADPLVERGRRWADVFLPISDEVGPRIDELRPVVQDLRAQLAERLPLFAAAASRLAARIDMGQVASAGRAVGTKAQGLTNLRPALPSAPSISAPAITAPRLAPVVRLPSLRLGAALRSIVRRLRPGRWAFRTTAVSLIALVMSNAALRDAMAEEVNWTRSVVQSIEIPAIQIPNFELPTLELPAIQIPAFEMPNFQFPQQSAAAPAKLAPAQFELPPLNAYRANFETQASYPTAAPNQTVEWVVALRNTGSAGWYRGVAGAQAALALTDGTEVAVQTTPYVGPGQVGWFVVHFRAPAKPGAHPVPLFPRIDGRGELPNLGIYALVTVR